MMDLLRRAVSSSKPIIRIVSVATATSGIVYLKSNQDGGSRISMVIPESVGESLSLPWMISPSLIHRPDQSLFGNFTKFSSKSSSESDTPRIDEKRVADDQVGSDDPKPSVFLGSDTIANAAARVGPAVVNLSVPQDFRKSIGSGTICHADGMILTCAHVVVDFQNIHHPSKGRVNVTLQDGRTFQGVVVNIDLLSDIALVK